MKIMTLLFTILLQSCGNLFDTTENSNYDKLCEIYQDVVKKPIAMDLKRIELYEQIENSLPVFFEKNYKYIMNSDRVERYSMIQQSAKFDGVESWECEAAKKFYSMSLVQTLQEP